VKSVNFSHNSIVTTIVAVLKTDIATIKSGYNNPTMHAEKIVFETISLS